MLHIHGNLFPKHKIHPIPHDHQRLNIQTWIWPNAVRWLNVNTYYRACATTVFSRVSAHLRVSAHPFLMILWSVCMQIASPCKRPLPFFGRKFQAPQSA